MSTAVSSLSSVASLLLGQAPSCHWALNRDLVFIEFLGNPRPLFGCEAGELVGRNLKDVLPVPAGRVWEERVERVFEGETFTSLEMPRPEGSAFALKFFPLLGETGQVLHAGGFALDATQSRIAERELRATVLRVIHARETEQARVSRFLHDDVGQSLTAAGMRLDLLRMDFESRVPELDERTRAIQELLEGVMNRIRDLSYELNPSVVERAGLHAALDRLAGRSRRMFTGTLRFMSDSSLHLPAPVGSAMYKIAQEAIHNAIRHSGCSQLELLVKTTHAGPALEVRDNGCGFETAPAADGRLGLGLMLMEHYAGQANLRLEVASRRGKGTVVRVIYERPAAG
ncbi:MAG: PAS domain-containing protein [Bryobacterales bacterium]|nr:PAS domain-containing protein [Bryobacterales bacterium]